MSDHFPATRWFELPHAPAPGTMVAQVEALADGSATMITLDALDNNVFRLLLLRTGPDVHAFANRCPHFGVPLAGRQEQLLQKPGISISCNVHYARFRWSDGLCESGDCKGESLISVPLDVHTDGQVCIARDPVDQQTAGL